MKLILLFMLLGCVSCCLYYPIPDHLGTRQFNGVITDHYRIIDINTNDLEYRPHLQDPLTLESPKMNETWLRFYVEQVKGNRYPGYSITEPVYEQGLWDKQMENSQIHYLKESIPSTIEGGPIHAILHAYNNHLTWVVDPDDLWMMVVLLYSEYVEKHAEELRPLLVKHEGKKSVTVMDHAGDEENDSFAETFLDDIKNEMRAHLVSGENRGSIADLLENDFSTTTPIYTHLSTGAILDGLKHYFEYYSMTFLCGFRRVQFNGHVRDYHRIIWKSQRLDEYYVKHEEFRQVLRRFEAVVQKFIDTFSGEVDQEWWRTGLDYERRRYGSGGQEKEYISGWVLHLFGKVEKTEIKNLNFKNINVHINRIDPKTNTEWDMYMVGGFNGIHLSPENEGVRPVVSLAIIRDLASQREMSEKSHQAAHDYHSTRHEL